MARKYAPLILAIWQNPEFVKLNADEQQLFFLIISQPNINYCGVLPYMPGRWSKLAGDTSATKVRRAAKALETARFVQVDTDTEELWVRSFVKHNDVLKQGNVAKAMRSAFPQIASLPIRQAFYSTLPPDEQAKLPDPFPPAPGNGKAHPQGEPQGEALGEPQGDTLDPTSGLGYVDVSSGFDLDPNLSPKPSSSTLAQTEPDDDDRLGPFVEEQLWQLWAKRDRQRLIDETGQYPHDDESWLVKAGNNRRSRHGKVVAKLLIEEPFLLYEDVIERLEKREEHAKPHPLDVIAVAARAMAEKDRSCDECHGTGWLDDGADSVLPCHCRAAS